MAFAKSKASIRQRPPSWWLASSGALGRSRAYREQAMTFDKLSRRHLLQGTAALTLGTALPLRRLAADTTVGFIYVGSRDDYGYNQAHAAGRRRAEEDARHQGRRGRESARDRRRREDHGVDDQSRRRDAAVPDLVRLLQPAHDQDGAASSRSCASSIAAACGPRRIRRTPAAISATSTKRSTSAASSPAIRPNPASSASSPPSRSRRCCATSTPSRWAPSSPIRRSPCR